MRQEQFVARHEAEWQAFDTWLAMRAGNARRARRTRREWRGVADHEIPARYRRICQQLAVAQQRGYSPAVTERLQQLMQRGHAVLYRPPPTRLRRVAMFLIAGFPRLVRREAACMAAAAALFLLPLVAVFAAIQVRPELSSALFDPMQLAQYEAMYDPTAERLGRDSGTDVAMFGVYVWNNVSIGFRCFASGMLAMVGAVVVLLFNGATIGGVAGHLQAVGHGDPFWRFVAGHSAPELTALVIAGGAGLRLGLALVAPGRRRRTDALVDAGRVGARLCAGVLAMLVFAAFVEAFWSSIASIPAAVKYAVAAVLWSGIGLWLWRGGRGLPEADG